jgi:iron(III) transport system ATP-binding protein
MSEPFLICRGLSKQFGRITAVRDLELRVEQGHTLALLGPSGCGKTTLLRLIAGFERPNAGSVELGRRSLVGRGTFVAPERRRVGMVFQDYALFPHLSVEANVAFGLPRGGDRRRARALLSLVGLDGLGSRMPHELSGGQQQRVALARSLAAEPELVLLDEPFSNLDPLLRVQVRADVRRILESLGTTAIFVTHDQEEALSLAGQVAVMLDGTIHQVGTPWEVYTRPASRHVAEFMGDANFLPGVVGDGFVDCELGTLPVLAAFAGPAEVMVRAENLQLSAETGLPVEVVGGEFFGHDQVILVRLSGDRVLRVRSLADLNVAPGQRLGLRVSGGVVAYPADP